MRALLVLSLALWGMISAAATQAQASDPMAAYYGNTLECRSGNEQCQIWLKPDGSFQRFKVSVGGDGSLKLVGNEGRFEASTREGKPMTCLLPRKVNGPTDDTPTECFPLTGHKLGDAWSAPTTSGTSIRFALIKGHRDNDGTNFLE